MHTSTESLIVAWSERLRKSTTISIEQIEIWRVVYGNKLQPNIHFLIILFIQFLEIEVGFIAPHS